MLPFCSYIITGSFKLMKNTVNQVARGGTEIISKVASHLLLDSDQKNIEYNGQVFGGLNISISQEKKRQVKKMEDFTIDCFYNEKTTKTIFNYLEGDKNMSIIQKIKKQILNKMEISKEYTIKELQNDNGSNSTRAALKELESEQKIKVRNPETGESINGKKLNKRASIYSLKK